MSNVLNSVITPRPKINPYIGFIKCFGTNTELGQINDNVGKKKANKNIKINDNLGVTKANKNINKVQDTQPFDFANTLNIEEPVVYKITDTRSTTDAFMKKKKSSRVNPNRITCEQRKE